MTDVGPPPGAKGKQMRQAVEKSNFHRKFHRAAFFRAAPQPVTPSGRIDGVFTLCSVSPDTTLSGAACAYLAHLEAQAALGRTSPHTVAARRYRPDQQLLGRLEPRSEPRRRDRHEARAAVDHRGENVVGGAGDYGPGTPEQERHTVRAVVSGLARMFSPQPVVDTTATEVR